MRKLIYSISLVLMLAVCLQAASAITDLGGVKATTCIQLPQTCATCTYNNLSSVQLPDKTYALQGEYAMQKTGTSYNYTFCNTVQLGTYLVDGHGDIGGVDTGWGGYVFEVTSSGFTIGVGQSLIYILFLLICVLMIGLSVRVIYKYPFEEDKLKPSQEYELKQRDNLAYYTLLLKRKFWLVGMFGIYIFTFLFTSILNSVALNFNLLDLNILLITVNNVLAWGWVPLVLFAIIYLLVFFYKSVESIMHYEFGGGGRE